MSISGILVGFAILFQIAPIVLSELFVIVTMLSALPIYIITRLSFKNGIIAFIAVSIIVFTISPHEGIIFIFANGPIGLSIGGFSPICRSSRVVALFTSIILTLSLSIINFIIGINIFGIDLPGNLFTKLVLIFLFMFIYSYIYMDLSKKVINYLNIGE